MKNRLFTGLAAGATLALVAATPSFAVDYTGTDISIGADGGTWAFDEFGDLSLDGYETTSGDSGSAWDNTNFYLHGSDGTTWDGLCASPAQITESDAADTVVCDPELVDNGDGELTVVSEMRFYANEAIVRHRVILTNDTDADISDQVLEFFYNSYQDSSTSLSWAGCCGILDDWSGALPIDGTESGFHTDHTDLSWATDDRDAADTEAPVVKYAVARADSESLPLNEGDYVSGGHAGGRGSAEDDVSIYFAVPTLAPGQTVEFLVFAQVFTVEDSTADGALSGWEAGTRDAIVAAAADDSLTDDDIIFAGIENRARVANWTEAGDEESGLADTGFDSAALGSIALFALAGGVAIAVRRRVVK